MKKLPEGRLARLDSLGSLGASTYKSNFEKVSEGRLARIASLGSLGANTCKSKWAFRLLGLLGLFVC